MCAGRTWTPRPPRREKADELRGRRAHAVRVHRACRRPGPALHARADRPGRRGRARRGDGRRGPGYETEIALSGEYGELLGAAAPTATTPPPSAWKRSRPIVDAWTACARTTAPRTGRRPRSTAICCAARGLPSLTVALVYFNVATEEETMLVETHPAAELEAFFNAQCERYRLGAAGAGAPGRARRGAGGTALSARPQRPARAGGGRLPQGARWRLPAGAGADRHRQNAGHLVSAAGRARGRPDKLFFRPPRGRARAAAGAGHAERAAAPACGCWSCRRATSSASIRTRRAMASPARWREALRPPAAGPRRALAHGRMDAAALRRSRRRTTSAPITGAGIDALERRGGG